MKEGFTGISFPFRVNSHGGIAMSTTSLDDISHIRESLEQILLTTLGERVNNPEFGNTLSSYLFSPLDASIFGMMKYELSQVIDKFEPRINIVDLQAFNEEEKIILQLDFTVEKYESAIFSTQVSLKGVR